MDFNNSNHDGSRRRNSGSRINTGVRPRIIRKKKSKRKGSSNRITNSSRKSERKSERKQDYDEE